ncbi:MAG: hypothetical protein NXH95_18495 [Pseudomonadaceae bacterium]|nr:hypothetical protein [Pseudomonadaceae bacterium]
MPKTLLTWITAGALLLSAAPGFASDNEPSAGEMAADIVIARPLGLVTTVLGGAAFVVSLPFSALGGNVEEAADALFLDPAKATFVRCLGCRATGKYQSPDE